MLRVMEGGASRYARYADFENFIEEEIKRRLKEIIDKNTEMNAYYMTNQILSLFRRYAHWVVGEDEKMNASNFREFDTRNQLKKEQRARIREMRSIKTKGKTKHYRCSRRHGIIKISDEHASHSFGSRYEWLGYSYKNGKGEMVKVVKKSLKGKHEPIPVRPFLRQSLLE
jgi:arginyl-tRNA--protein-N-Asp/Glu arginylyltransferase